LIEALLGLGTHHRFRLYFNWPPALGQFAAQSSASHSVELRQIRFPRMWTHVRLGLELARRPPDVLFVPSHVLPLWTRPPAVVTVHDLGYLYFPEAHPARQRWYLDWSTRHNVRTARIVLADSQATKDDLMAHYGVEETKIVVAHPGLDEALAPVEDESTIAAVKRCYGIRDDYVIHIGTLQPRKNLARLIEAFGRLRAGEVQLVLAGKKGWLYEDLFRQVRRLGLEDRVLFPGYVDQADKAALLSGALACVFPSLYEGFGFPALEAQTCETALICANGSSLPEVVGDGALLVDPLNVDHLSDAIQRVLSSRSLRADLIERGRSNRKRFSWRACAETVMRVLETAADARMGKARDD
jgi:glycosyltransferase involved in cell wall biosynthesis